MLNTSSQQTLVLISDFLLEVVRSRSCVTWRTDESSSVALTMIVIAVKTEWKEITVHGRECQRIVYWLRQRVSATQEQTVHRQDLIPSGVMQDYLRLSIFPHSPPLKNKHWKKNQCHMIHWFIAIEKSSSLISLNERVISQRIESLIDESGRFSASVR